MRSPRAKPRDLAFLDGRHERRGIKKVKCPRRTEARAPEMRAEYDFTRARPTPYAVNHPKPLAMARDVAAPTATKSLRRR